MKININHLDISPIEKLIHPNHEHNYPELAGKSLKQIMQDYPNFTIHNEELTLIPDRFRHTVVPEIITAFKDASENFTGNRKEYDERNGIFRKDYRYPSHPYLAFVRKPRK